MKSAMKSMPFLSLILSHLSLFLIAKCRGPRRATTFLWWNYAKTTGGWHGSYGGLFCQGTAEVWYLHLGATAMVIPIPGKRSVSHVHFPTLHVAPSLSGSFRSIETEISILLRLKVLSTDCHQEIIANLEDTIIIDKTSSLNIIN